MAYAHQLQLAAMIEGPTVTRFVYGSKSNVPDMMIQGAITYRMISDQVGSPRYLVQVGSAAGTTPAMSVNYDSFGLITASTGTRLMPFGFAGGIYDSDTGLVRFGARDYDATIGRWIAKDPTRWGGGQPNLYVYVNGDPLNQIDPTGRYGTNDCSYYKQRCAESGGDYYCKTAPDYCDNVFPKPPDPDPTRNDDYEGFARCVRQCLQDCDKQNNDNQNSCPSAPDPKSDGFWDEGSLQCHNDCYQWCPLWGAGLLDGSMGP